MVTGGGIAGTCAAITAARLGLKVALIEDRPVLGGNNSSEVRVWLQGARNEEPWPNVGNVVAELEQDRRDITVPRTRPNSTRMRRNSPWCVPNGTSRSFSNIA